MPIITPLNIICIIINQIAPNLFRKKQTRNDLIQTQKLCYLGEYFTTKFCRWRLFIDLYSTFCIILIYSLNSKFSWFNIIIKKIFFPRFNIQTGFTSIITAIIIFFIFIFCLFIFIAINIFIVRLV